MTNSSTDSQFPDLSSCEREPIHLHAAIEPNGCLLVVSDPELVIVQVSSNTSSLLAAAPEALLGKHLREIFWQDSIHRLTSGITESGKPNYISGLRAALAETSLDALVHRQAGLLIIELEPRPSSYAISTVPNIYTSLTDATAELEGALPLMDLCQRVATRVRNITGFDRVMVYRFLKDDTGCVIAEDLHEALTPYLGLRYPASDIPAQARRFYLINTLRLKVDVNAEVAVLTPALNPITGAALDMSFCILRAMSPVHVEYLRNMGVAASMSISIVKDGRLWGLIACHHREAKLVPHAVRITCDVLARVFSSHIAAAGERDEHANASAFDALTAKIEARLSVDLDLALTLRNMAGEILPGLGAQGCIFSIRGKVASFGVTPKPAEVEALLNWLSLNQTDHVMATERLAALNPTPEGLESSVCGLLSVRIALSGSDFLVWFRPPIVKVVTWGGNPEKPVEETEAGRRISPRRSFEKWKQTFQDSSEPWTDTERKFAATLRPLAAETMLSQMNEEVVRLNIELTRSNIELESFSYTAGHDLQEPVRTIRAYAQLLARTAGTDLSDEARGLLKTIEDSAARMGNLIKTLLSYSQLGGMPRRESQPVKLDDVFRWVLASLGEQIRASGAEITHDDLPVVSSDLDYMEQLLQNLISNAIKYRRLDLQLRIHLSWYRENDFSLVSVRDNGQGFDPQYAGTIFTAFKRLHGREVPGNGVGLATCKKIVELHNGRIWAESDGPNQGATFWFTLPLYVEQPIGKSK